MSRAFAGLAGLVLVSGIAAVPAAARAAESREIQRTVALDGHGTVALRTFKGSIVVEPWDDARAEVVARIEADTTCGNDSQQAERVRRTRVDFETAPSRLEVRSNYDDLENLAPIPYHVSGFDSTCSANPFIHYRLRVPRTAKLDIEDHKSRIAIDGMRADARISTHKGHVEVKAHDGALDLTTHKGEVHVAFARLGGPSRLETYKGDIEISMPKSAGYDLDARVERGGMLEAGFPLDETIVNRRERVYDQKVNGGGPLLTLTTRSGSIRIR